MIGWDDTERRLACRCAGRTDGFNDRFCLGSNAAIHRIQSEDWEDHWAGRPRCEPHQWLAAADKQWRESGLCKLVFHCVCLRDLANLLSTFEVPYLLQRSERATEHCALCARLALPASIISRRILCVCFSSIAPPSVKM